MKNNIVIRILYGLVVLFFLTYCESKTEPEWRCGEVAIDTLINTVSNLKLVTEKSKLIDSISNHTRKLSFYVQPFDTLNVIYLIKVCEDNKSNVVTYFNFKIDIRTHEILNPSGMLDGQEDSR